MCIVFATVPTDPKSRPLKVYSYEELRPYFAQVTSLQIGNYNTTEAEFQCEEHYSLYAETYLPALKELCIQVNDPENLIAVDLPEQNFPALTKLELDGVYVRLDNPILSRLEVLKLSNHPSARGPRYSFESLAALSNWTNLVELTLDRLLDIVTVAQVVPCIPRITLPRVEKLWITSAPHAVQQFLLHLFLPAAKEVWIRGCFGSFQERQRGNVPSIHAMFALGNHPLSFLPRDWYESLTDVEVTTQPVLLMIHAKGPFGRRLLLSATAHVQELCVSNEAFRSALHDVGQIFSPMKDSRVTSLTCRGDFSSGSEDPLDDVFPPQENRPGYPEDNILTWLSSDSPYYRPRAVVWMTVLSHFPHLRSLEIADEGQGPPPQEFAAGFAGRSRYEVYWVPPPCPMLEQVSLEGSAYCESFVDALREALQTRAATGTCAQLRSLSLRLLSGRASRAVWDGAMQRSRTALSGLAQEIEVGMPRVKNSRL